MKKYLTILFICVFYLTGCTKFLDVKSNETLVVPQTLDDLQAILDHYTRMNDGKVPAWGESITDDYYLTESILNLNNQETQEFYVWNYLDYYGNFNDWGHGYQPIFNANLVLDIISNVEKTSLNEYQWNNIKGSALFFRSFYFYHLLTVFSEGYDESTAHNKLGIVLRLSSDFNDKSRRSTIQECFDQIETDLKSSIELLPDNPILVTRPSKAAVYALLAKIFIYKRDYVNALKYSELTLQIKSDLMNFNADDDILENVSNTATPFKRFNKETIFYADLSSSRTFFPNGTRAGIIDSNLYNSYETNDLRKQLYFRIAGGLPYYRGSYSGSSTLFGGLSTNEIYLIGAESAMILKQADKAKVFLFHLLQNRYSSFDSEKLDILNPEQLLQYIRDHRRKELIFQGIRFTDIKRFNLEGQNIVLKRVVNGNTYILEPNSKKYVLPLPADLVKLTGLEQN